MIFEIIGMRVDFCSFFAAIIGTVRTNCIIIVATAFFLSCTALSVTAYTRCDSVTEADEMHKEKITFFFF